MQNPGGWQYGIAQVKIKSAKSTIHDLDGTKLGFNTNTFEYDHFGNATTVLIERSDGTGSETISKFTNDTEKWHLGRLTRSTATLYNEQGEKQTRTSSFAYNPEIGLLNRETSYVGHPKSVTITYEHDEFGNTVFTTTTAKGLSSRTATIKFDKEGRFPVETANALGHKSRAQYDPVFGTVVEATDPNEVTVRTEYDSFGAVRTEISPTRIRAVSIYAFLPETMKMADGSVAIFRTTAKVGDLPESSVLLDGQGRTLRTMTEGEGGQTVIQDILYDEFKRPYRVSTPHFAGTPKGEIGWTQTTYDVSDRPLSVTTPDGGITHYKYKELTTTITDKLNRKTVTRYNLRKLPLSVTDPVGGTIRYSYDVGDRLIRLVNADGSVTRHKYDDLGQRSSTHDPDLGLWQYRYNAYGELVWQQDAKKQNTTISYDVLGRPICKVEADQKTTWEYDTVEHGLGKLAKVTGREGYSESYLYDRLGRRIQTQVWAMGEEFVSSSEFDAYNRTTILTYPTLFKVLHHYDNRGFMRLVTNADDGFIYWEGLRYDHFGNVVEEIYGNGVRTTHQFDPKIRYLKEIKAVNNQGKDVQNISYNYDLAGNVVSRNNACLGRNESFHYDRLDRLIETKVDGRVIQSQRYDLTGRILHKSDVGTYHYGENGAPSHAVSSISGWDGKKVDYTYDANGNLMSGPKIKKAYYTAGNLTAAIHGDQDTWSEFKYSPTGQKYLQEMRDGPGWMRTLYLGLYERIQEEMVPPFKPTNERLRHRHYVATPSGVCAIVEKITEFFPVRHSPQLRRLSPRGGNRNERTTRQVASTVYLHSDTLGSINAITDSTGIPFEFFGYDPWGKRLEPEKQKERYYTYKNGFTGHDHVDHLNLIHMGGRVYDPDVGLFTRADPITPTLALTNAQNRFAYVLNNPLKFTDPTGLSIFGDIWGAVTKPFKKAINWLDKKVFRPVGKWLERNWKTVVVITAAVVVSVVTYGAATPYMSKMTAGILAGMASGAVAAGTSTGLYGGDLGDVLQSMLAGGAKGALAGAFFGAAAEISSGWGLFGQGMAYGTTGGINSMMQRGTFQSGFISSAFVRFMSPATIKLKGFSGAGLARSAM